MKALFLVQNFRQGWGGAPESVRLMARRLSAGGVTSDVNDGDKLFTAVERMENLPTIADMGETMGDISAYHAILIVGPWQRMRTIRNVLGQMRKGQQLHYLPRGGLARIEFRGKRWLKKMLYLAAIERSFMRRADSVIYSSRAEQDATVRLARHLTTEHIVADIFEALPLASTNAVRQDSGRFSTLGEISPRKGLVELADAFIAWADQTGRRNSVQLTIGGGVRAGYESYFAQLEAICHSAGGLIRMIGSVPHAERPQFYAGTDVFIVPSQFESFGLTALECLAAGCSLLVSPKVGVMEYIASHPQVTIAEGLKREQLVAGLERSYIARDASNHAAVSLWADSVIDGINVKSFGQWFDILGKGVSHAPID
ncbi:MAG: glycosyltransferase [Sphingomonadales bacterium]|nr:MAG: glycosyltransferase [Sphingomonadales bacterium]